MNARNEKKPSYLLEMLLHPFNGYAALSAVLAGALVSIPFGLGVGLLPIIGFGAAEAIAALFIPSHPGFREWVDKRARARGREQVRQHLLDEIEVRTGGEQGPMWAKYQRMRERLESLSRMAHKHDTQLSDRDVEAFDDATVKFLGYWLAKLTISDRRDSIDERTLRGRLEQVSAQVEAATSRAERARLMKTQADLQALIDRKVTLFARQTEVETAMLTMADSLEEVYLQVVANPTAPEVGTQLREAAERMRLEEGLDHAIDLELGEVLRPSRARTAQVA